MVISQAVLSAIALSKPKEASENDCKPMVAKASEPADLKYLKPKPLDEKPPLAKPPVVVLGKPAEKAVYVVYSGMFGSNGQSARQIKAELIARGIPEEQILIPEEKHTSSTHPYPDVTHDCEALEPDPPPRAGWLGWWDRIRRGARNAFRTVGNGFRNVRNFVTNLYNYWQLRNPNSHTSQAAYQRLHAVLPKSEEGKPLEVNFVCYSGGAHQGGTMAKLLTDRNPDVRVARMITLGSPWVSNNTPPHVALYTYVSQADDVLSWTSLIPFVRRVPANLDKNDVERDFPGVTHDQWPIAPGVFRQIIQDLGHGQPLQKEVPKTVPLPAFKPVISPDDETIIPFRLPGYSVFAARALA